MEKELKRHYMLIVDFLGHILGPDYEIALHELNDDSNEIIAIANGELTGRHLGSPLSNKMLEYVAGNLYETQNYVLNFESVSATGKTMCSNSMFIKGRHGELSGLLCINFDASRYEELSRRVMELCGGGVKRGVPSGTRLIADGNDPVEIVNHWSTCVEDGYLTLRFRTYYRNGSTHRLNLVKGDKPNEVVLYHDAAGDNSGLVRDGLMAFRLESFPESTGTPVEMTLKWKSYSGEKTLKFKYIPRK